MWNETNIDNMFPIGFYENNDPYGEYILINKEELLETLYDLYDKSEWSDDEMEDAIQECMWEKQ